MKKIEIFFFGLFPKLILNNEIVASIISVVNKKLSVLKDEIDETLNIDV